MSVILIIHTSAIDGVTKRVSETLTFDEGGLVVAGEVFLGVVIAPAPPPSDARTSPRQAS